MKETHYYDIYKNGERATSYSDLESAMHWARMLSKHWTGLTVVHRTVIEDEPIIVSKEC